MFLNEAKSAIYCGFSNGVFKSLVGKNDKFTVEGEIQLEGNPLAQPGEITSIDMPASRDSILVGTSSCNMYLVNPATLSFKLVTQAHNSQIVGLDVQASVMASFDQKATLRLWNISEGYKALRTVPNHPLNNSPGSCLAFGEAPFLLQGFENGDINCINVATGKQDWSLLKTHKGGVTTMLMVVGLNHRTSSIW